MVYNICETYHRQAHCIAVCLFGPGPTGESLHHYATAYQGDPWKCRIRIIIGTWTRHYHITKMPHISKPYLVFLTIFKSCVHTSKLWYLRTRIFFSPNILDISGRRFLFIFLDKAWKEWPEFGMLVYLVDLQYWLDFGHCLVTLA